jgi:hypothetical protein
VLCRTEHLAVGFDPLNSGGGGIRMNRNLEHSQLKCTTSIYICGAMGTMPLSNLNA